MIINETEIDFSKQRGYFFNMDCMDALKQMPDKCIDLCICDPPYGDGIAESSQICQVERETAKPWNRFGGQIRQVQDRSHIMRSESASAARVTRTGGTWARKYEKNCNVGCSPEAGVF